MLKVLLVDDEPMILKGLQVLIDWNKVGFEIAATVNNVIDALNYLYKNRVDLIISDIQMPKLSGLDLMEKVKKENISDAHFVLLSGHADFDFAQRAIRYNCIDYILKPINKENLIKVLSKISKINEEIEYKTEVDLKMGRAYLARNIIALISGKYDNENLKYIKSHMKLSVGVRYIDIELDTSSIIEKISCDKKREFQKKLFQTCIEYNKNDESHCIFDVSRLENIYDIGFIFCDYMAEEKKCSEEEYLKSFFNYLKNKIDLPVNFLVGKKVKDISCLSKSYDTISLLRTFKGFRSKKDIYYHEKESQPVSSGVNLLCKKSIDELLKNIEHNDHAKIVQCVKTLYQKMQSIGAIGEVMSLNINYLLFQLIHLAIIQDNSVNQKEIFRLISESSIEEGIARGSKAHLADFSCKYSDYLTQLRRNCSKGVLGSIEKDIRDNFNKNITLKELSEKYYVNTAYLGQKFRKKHGCSFKDYLNNFRIEQAAILLLRTDDKIYKIAEDVGYHNQDYFIRRFIAIKNCTPTTYRKNTCSINV
ncbi:response regulator [Thiospirochaeta perfilievii]|uniref:Response regulator n=1 Tax=Thiospirochaeta perfilievii TaxID=252967 RepID=A0A5C1Q9X2_9SPIO|nr:response regulator [Thiospirochaeta perfilievii]QEN03444.1 response regulator [Thiospirochaeta perfilievii]